MGWERTKATTVALPLAPSSSGWLLGGVVAVICGVLLFILHASDVFNQLPELNIWWLSLAPIIGWFFLFCLRGWLWGRKVDEYQFLLNEAAHGQLQWESWAGRYLAVLGSSVLLPGGVTAEAIARPGGGGNSQYLSLSCHFQDDAVDVRRRVTLCLNSVQNGLAQLPASLPVNITIVADGDGSEWLALIKNIWAEIYPERLLPTSISVCDSYSLAWIEERLKQPTLDVDLILALQINPLAAYSDGLAALLLTSDDVAQKYHLPHTTRLLRPMQLDMTMFKSEMNLFLETQKEATLSERVFCDDKTWNHHFADALTVGGAYQARWKPEEIAVLEKYSGIPGPASGWLLAALVADVVSINKTSVLGLFTSGADHFVSTIIPGSENNDAG